MTIATLILTAINLGLLLLFTASALLFIHWVKTLAGKAAIVSSVVLQLIQQAQATATPNPAPQQVRSNGQEPTVHSPSAEEKV